MLYSWVYANIGIAMQAKKETRDMVMYSGKRKARKLKLKQSIYTKNSAPGNSCIHRV